MDAGSLLAADVALYRAARTRGHSPRAEHAVRAFSRTGEHAALWLAIGGLGMALDRPRRARWRRGVKATAAAYVLNTAIKLVRRNWVKISAGVNGGGTVSALACARMGDSASCTI